MLNFSPNIYVLQYLEASNQIDEKTKSKLQRFMRSGKGQSCGWLYVAKKPMNDVPKQSTNKFSKQFFCFVLSFWFIPGYQRELNYKHNDGSYSAFGNSDASGSTWLTAFVVKSFAESRPYITIDSTELSMSTDWLKSTQLENGCFESRGKVLHKEMKVIRLWSNDYSIQMDMPIMNIIELKE